MATVRCNEFVKLILIFAAMSCSSSKQAQIVKPIKETNIAVTDSITKPKSADETFFETLFKHNPGILDSVKANKDNWKVQIIYTQINRSKKGKVSLKKFYFNKNGVSYYYPASTVKLPTALLALQRLNELKAKGIDKNTSMITDATYSGQTAVYNDPNTLDGRPSIAQYIKRVLLLSDNDAFNRLYEFLGQQYINDELHKKGYTDAQILHRLNIFLSEAENRHTNPVSFYDASNQLIYSQPMLYNKAQYQKRNDSLGKQYYSGGKLINGPMDFSKKNRLCLDDLNTIITGLIFPEAINERQRFNITEVDRDFMLKYMSSFPGESVYPDYDSSYNDTYAKFILYGGVQGALPKDIRIFDKSGDAYGQMIDAAYVVDFDKKIEFMVSAEIYCNKDGVLNDDKYDYNTIGLPFMKSLGQALYNYELKRKRNFKPDLTSMKFIYDK
jgi:hypothetical protein